MSNHDVGAGGQMIVHSVCGDSKRDVTRQSHYPERYMLTSLMAYVSNLHCVSLHRWHDTVPCSQIPLPDVTLCFERARTASYRLRQVVSHHTEAAPETEHVLPFILHVLQLDAGINRVIQCLGQRGLRIVQRGLELLGSKA